MSDNAVCEANVGSDPALGAVGSEVDGAGAVDLAMVDE